jgi:hypothetical protein
VPPLLICLGVDVIKIRYSDLSAGLHASAKSEGKHTVIYLVPGLSSADRRSAIDRLRASARFGHGPPLPAIPLAMALIADRITVTGRNAIAAARLHPTGVAIPVIALAIGSVAYVLLVTVSLHIGPPAASNSVQLPGPAVTASGQAGTARPGSPGDHGTGPGSASQLTGRGGPGSSGHQAGLVPHGSPTPSAGSTPTPSQSPGSTPTATPGPTTTSRAPTPSPSPSPSRSQGGGGGGKGLCINLLNLLGICINL